MVMKSGRMRWVENVARTGEIRNTYKILSRIPEGKRSLGRPWGTHGKIILKYILNMI
jgi:hypothetical protein